MLRKTTLLNLFNGNFSRVTNTFSSSSKSKWIVDIRPFNLALVQCRYCNAKSELKTDDVKKLLDNAALFENEDGPDSAWSTSPYPKGTSKRLQYRHALRPSIDPRETSLIIFPGEGSQYVGMGHRLLHFAGVKDIFDAANEILKYDLLSLCLQGPKSKLDQTKYAQVAVMVCSFAALEKLKEERPSMVDNCVATAGFSIGELTALTFAGAISFERAIRLAQLRGEAMQTASEAEPSAMLTVMYKPDTKLHEVLKKAKEYASIQGVEKPVCEVAHYLFPHCKVVAGHKQCLDYIKSNYKSLNIGGVRLLNIQGAHHTRLMEPAAMAFKRYLMKSNIQETAIAVHSSVDGKIYDNPQDIVKKLSRQIMLPVKWEQLLHVLYERPVGQQFPRTIECGPGDSLKTILKMVNAKAFDVCEAVFEEPAV